MERKAVSQHASRPFGVPQLPMKRSAGAFPVLAQRPYSPFFSTAVLLEEAEYPDVSRCDDDITAPERRRYQFETAPVW